MAFLPRGIPGVPIPRYFSNGLRQTPSGFGDWFFTVNLEIILPKKAKSPSAEANGLEVGYSPLTN
jgi:hypothetical protein